MDLWRQFDLYCERLGPGLWAEPLNVLSNLAFLLAAYIVFRQRRAAERVSTHAALLIWLIALVGVGSAAFHFYASLWARWLDLLFIELFIYCYLAWYLRGVFALSWPKVLAWTIAFAVFEWGVNQAFEPGSFNGSYRYLPALIVVACMSFAAIGRLPGTARGLGIACGIFVLAVALRTLDMRWCARWPWGTHFLWHILNALVLYFCMAALRRARV
jgi:hypothetical protein